MKIELHHISIRALTDGYVDKTKTEGGVVAYRGRLDVRPPYQRNFVYNHKQERAVIKSILHDFPLNVMYWAVRNDGTFEIIDGQQRTISIARYVKGKFSIKDEFTGKIKFFDTQPEEIKNLILDYELMVYHCTGTDQERLDWFHVINTAGERLKDQEIRNAVYVGPWVSDARSWFSRKNNCPASKEGSKYLNGNANDQDYLETAIKWIAGGSGSKIDEYMAQHQQDPDATVLWNYFLSVINWVRKDVFPRYRSTMKGVEWGLLFNEYKDGDWNPDELEKEISELLKDPDVTHQKGIYAYVLSRDPHHLNIRAFDKADKSIKRRVYEKQGGKCASCNKKHAISNMHADHITPWIEGGKTVEANCQVLCGPCNRRKSAK